MKRLLIATLACLLVVLACGQQFEPPGKNTPVAKDIDEWTPFAENNFNVTLPAEWNEEAASDTQVIHAVGDGNASLWIKSWPLIPSIVARSVRDWITENGQASLLSESGDASSMHMEISLTENFSKMRLSSFFIYCDAKTYEVTGVALDNQFSQYSKIFSQAQESAKCNKVNRPSHLESGALGMIVIPPSVDGESFDPAAYQQSLALARESGVQVSHYYFHWGDIEKAPGTYDWTVPDYIVEANSLEGLQLSVVVSIIHTTVRGRIPDDLIGLPFDDSKFTERLSEFLSAFANRYTGRLHYLSIGNEVNNYFAVHRDEVQAYASAFRQTRESIHAVNPTLSVGIVFAYHDAETLGTTDIIQDLNLGDHLAYTIYLYNSGFHFRRDPAEIGNYLDRMTTLAGDIPVIIVETGWSTAPELDGSEEGQAEFVRQLFQALSNRRDHIRFVSLFIMHDPDPESCISDAFTFFEPGTEPDQDFMEAFTIFICHFGLRKNDGTPKLAWEVWVQEAQEYYK